MNSDPIIDNDQTFMAIYTKCKDYTMTSQERMYGLYKAVEYAIQAKVPGDFVECGVWKGGSSMLIAYTLAELGVKDRKIYLYDTFEGMTMPTEDDKEISNHNALAMDTWEKEQKEDHNEWAYSPLSEVKNAMAKVDYPTENIIFVKGKVEDTIPHHIPSAIALLRLDTDWYESTKHELQHLYPLVSKNGILIIDDYGCWDGSKKATDEYFSNTPVMLNRMDAHGRLILKTL